MTVPSSRAIEHATDLHVQKATAQDLPALAETLAAAFQTDPFMSWWIPDPERRRVLLPTASKLSSMYTTPSTSSTPPAPLPPLVLYGSHPAISRRPSRQKM